jgi:opacity protein-like surface antigen
LGAGVELMLGPRLSVDVDFRYIFLNPTNDQVLHHDFNYGQITAGVNLFF